MDLDFTSAGFIQCHSTAFSEVSLVIGASKVKSKEVASCNIQSKQQNRFLGILLYLSATAVLKATAQLCYKALWLPIKTLFHIALSFRSCFSVLQPFQAEPELMLMTSASMSIPQTIAGL